MSQFNAVLKQIYLETEKIAFKEIGFHGNSFMSYHLFFSKLWSFFVFYPSFSITDIDAMLALLKNSFKKLVRLLR